MNRMASPTANPTLADLLDQHTAIGALGFAEGERLRCVACGHRCLIGAGKRGICKVRFNDGGQLRVPFGYFAGLQCDPVEKKPFFHVYPGSDALTFGMMGCDLHCSYCQNWVTSQALRDSGAVAPVRPITPGQLVDAARREGARLVVSSYNEPLITAEWAVAVFEQAKAAGLACAFVSNGNATPEVLDFLKPWIVAYKVDLKSFDDAHYRSLGGTLWNITDTIRMIHERGIWLEVVTLIIPSFNDSSRELSAMARFLASIDRDIPWHVTAFHQDYRMTDPDATPPATLMRAAEIGAEAGLRFVYAGNLPGKVGPWENTRCPGCGETLIERFGYLIKAYRVNADGGCQRCRERLPGIWPSDTGMVQTGNDQAAYRRRLPRPVVNLPLVIKAETTEQPKGAQRMLIALDEQQRERVVAVARSLVRDLAAHGRAPNAVGELAELGGHHVAGVFVSLKRGKHLRACCGMMGQPIPLPRALEEAATRTVLEDVRFPPVSPSEIDRLAMEIWLLHSPQPVRANGAERAEAVVIGRHGVQVMRGGQHGLFLPGVAIDNAWDSTRFLDQVCVKAGLHPSSWRDEATALFTFEGEMLRCEPAPDAAMAERRAAVCQAQDLAGYANFCRENIIAMLHGATPNYFMLGAADGNVNGVVLTIQIGSAARQLFELSLRPGVPLQSSLFALCQSAAQMLARDRITHESLALLHVHVALLHDPVLHGTVQEADLAGVDPRQRAILVAERNKTAVVFDPSKQPADLLAEAVRQAHVSQPAAAPVYSLDTLSHGPFAFSTAPIPVRGHAVRQPSAAGSFYPADPAALARMVDGFLQPGVTAESWPAALLPHAGLAYSGRLAAAVLQRIRIPRTVIVIGPKHTGLGMDWAVAPHQTWAFPGGSLESDFMLARQLCQAIPGLEMDAAAHQREHAIEVELPILARLAPQTRVVGLAIGPGDLAGCQRAAEGLAGVLKEREDRPLLLISSDMNHYATDAENRRLDAIALDALERLDPTELYQTVTNNQISMCGLLPAVIVLHTLRLLGGLNRAERVGYATSADVSGDKSRVVGYAGMLFG